MLYRNIIANYAGRGWMMAAIYLFVPIYIAILGTESYALIAFYSILLTFASLADVGLSSTFSRQAASVKDKNVLVGTFSTMEIILLVTTISIALILMLASPLIAGKWLNDISQINHDTVETCLKIMALTIPAQMMMTFYSAGMIGLQHQVSNNVVQSIYILIRSGLIVPILYVYPDPVVFFTWQLAITLIFAVILRMLFFFAMKFPPFTVGRYDFSYIRPILTFAGSMVLISIIATINTQIDKLVVSALFSVSDFGYYAAASMLSQLPVALATPIAVAFYPKLTQLIARNETASAKSLYNYFSALTSLAVALLAGGLIVLAPEILTLWMPKQHLPAAMPNIVRLLALGSLFYGLQIVPYYLSLARGEARIILILAIAGMLFTAPFSYLCVHLFGMVGASLPWIALNLMNFATIAYVVNRKAWGDGRLRWFVQCILMPTALGLVSILLGRLLAEAFSLNIIGTILMAGATGAAAIAIFWRFARPALTGDLLAT